MLLIYLLLFFLDGKFFFLHKGQTKVRTWSDLYRLRSTVIIRIWMTLPTFSLVVIHCTNSNFSILFIISAYKFAPEKLWPIEFTTLKHIRILFHFDFHLGIYVRSSTISGSFHSYTLFHLWCLLNAEFTMKPAGRRAGGRILQIPRILSDIITFSIRFDSSSA